MDRLLTESEQSENDPLHQSIIGIILMIIGAICTNLGNNLMSLGHSQQREIDRRKADQELNDEASGLSDESLHSKNQVEAATERQEARGKR